MAYSLNHDPEPENLTEVKIDIIKKKLIKLLACGLKHWKHHKKIFQNMFNIVL